MAKSAWKLESNRIAVQERMTRAAEKAANTTGRRAQERAQDTVHVITGRLKSTITHEVIPGLLILIAGGTASDGEPVNYAPYEEARHPFLWPAWESVAQSFSGEIMFEFGKGGSK